MNGFTLLALIVLAVGILIAYRAGAMRARRAMRAETLLRPAIVASSAASPTTATEYPAPVTAAVDAARPPASAAVTPAESLSAVDAERYRIVLTYEGEAAALRRELATARAEGGHLRALDAERRALHRALAASREETARYRQIVVDIENNAPPPLLDGPGAPDDLKLIVGVGPVLERMLQQLGINSYRQIARWSERDVDDFDAKLPEFHGRIRRDGWVTQARELHHSKYGESPFPSRG